MLRLPVTAVFLLIAASSSAFGQTREDEAGKSFRAARTEIAPQIDGALNDEVWGLANVVDDFHEIWPIEYDPPSQQTLVYVLYDEENLYIGARLRDTEPDGVTAQVLRQGSGINNDDHFAVILDPFLDRRSGYRFRLNPHGVRDEAIYQNMTDTQDDWQGIWQGQALIVDDGWTLEIAIPYKTLSFNPGTDSWGINFTRKIARNNETLGWVSRTRQQNPSVSGTAIGLSGLAQGVGLDVRPSLSVVESKDYTPGTTTSDTQPSLDVFYKFTPSMTGVLTVNTDFSATEIDDRQVNLTRFSLFFPEKRFFFLQDVDIFEFGRIGGGGMGGPPADQNGRPFFSRTIGLSSSREPVPIDAGAKLTGRVGDWNLGVLSIRQEEFEDVTATDLFVGRASLNVLEESNVGLIVTDGDPQSNLDNTLVGADFRYQNTRLPGRRSITSQAWFQQSDTPGLDGDDAAYGFGFDLSAPDKWSGDAKYIELQDNFNPALGFANRVGIREFDGGVDYAWRPRDRYLRTVFGGVSFTRSERLVDDSLQSESINARIFLTNHTSDNSSLSCSRDTEGLDEPFTILRRRNGGNVVIDPGIYEFDSCRVQVRIGGQRKLSGSFAYETGDFYNGSRDSLQPNVTWRPSEHFSLNVSSTVNDIELPQGKFTTRLTRLTTEVVFSATLSWVNLIQWDNGSDILGINSRLHWVPQAGRDFYLVLNHNLEDLDENGTFHSTRGDLTAKASYTFRF